MDRCIRIKNILYTACAKKNETHARVVRVFVRYEISWYHSKEQLFLSMFSNFHPSVVIIDQEMAPGRGWGQKTKFHHTKFDESQS